MTDKDVEAGVGLVALGGCIGFALVPWAVIVFLALNLIFG